MEGLSSFHINLNRVAVEDRGQETLQPSAPPLAEITTAITKTPALSPPGLAPAPYPVLVLSPAPVSATHPTQPSSPRPPLSSPRPAAAAFRRSSHCCPPGVGVSIAVSPVHHQKHHKHQRHQGRLFGDDSGKLNVPQQPIPALPPVETTTSRNVKPKQTQGLPSQPVVSEASPQEGVNHPKLGKDLISFSYIAPTPGQAESILAPTPAPAPIPALPPPSSRQQPNQGLKGPNSKPAVAWTRILPLSKLTQPQARAVPAATTATTAATDAVVGIELDSAAVVAPRYYHLKPQQRRESDEQSPPPPSPVPPSEASAGSKAPATVAITVGTKTFTAPSSPSSSSSSSSVNTLALVQVAESSIRVPASSLSMGFTGENRKKAGSGGGGGMFGGWLNAKGANASGPSQGSSVLVVVEEEEHSSAGRHASAGNRAAKVQYSEPLPSIVESMRLDGVPQPQPLQSQRSQLTPPTPPPSLQQSPIVVGEKVPRNPASTTTASRSTTTPTTVTNSNNPTPSSSANANLPPSTTAQKFFTFTRFNSAKDAFASSVFSSGSSSSTSANSNSTSSSSSVSASSSASPSVFSSSASPAAVSLHSSASSFVDGSSRPTTPSQNQKQSLTPATMSPARTVVSPLALKVVQPPHPALVNEFEGLNFDRLITSYLPPTIPDVLSDAASDDTDVIVPQARLEELASTAKDLLHRVYEAYNKRTRALEEALAEQGVLQEEVEEGKAKARHLKSQLETLDESYKKKAKEQDEVIGMLVKELESEKVRVEEERDSWERERKGWEEKERDRLRDEIIAEIMTQGTILPTPADGHEDDISEEEEEEDGHHEDEHHENHSSAEDEEDIHRTPRTKRTSLGAESSDSGFDESDNDGGHHHHDTEPLTPSTTTTTITPSSPTTFEHPLPQNTPIHNLQHKHSRASIDASALRKSSLTSIRTSATTPLPRKKSDNLTRRGTVIRMVPPPVINGKDIYSGCIRCENCARLTPTPTTSTNTTHLSRPASPTSSPSAIASPTNTSGFHTPTSPTQVNPLRFPTPLSKRHSDASFTTIPQTPTASTGSRWGFGVLRGGGGGGGGGGQGQQVSREQQVELDRLRGENRGLRERVGELEKSVDDVLGVLGGWRCR